MCVCVCVCVCVHRASGRVADTLHVLQRRLHHLLVHGIVLRAVRGHADATHVATRPQCVATMSRYECVAMLLLYWKIFRVINARARRTRLGHGPRSSGSGAAGADLANSGQRSAAVQTTWRSRLTGRRTFVTAVFNRCEHQ